MLFPLWTLFPPVQVRLPLKTYVVVIYFHGSCVITEVNFMWPHNLFGNQWCLNIFCSIRGNARIRKQAWRHHYDLFLSLLPTQFSFFMRFCLLFIPWWCDGNADCFHGKRRLSGKKCIFLYISPHVAKYQWAESLKRLQEQEVRITFVKRWNRLIQRYSSDASESLESE